MIRLRDTLGSDPITFHYAESTMDLQEIADFVSSRKSLGIDTESTGINCYRPEWRLRMFQIGNATDSYAIPPRYKKFIAWIMRQPMNWIGHNGPHDIRSIDTFLGYETGAVVAGETYIPAHHADSRGRAEGGIGHGLKEQAIAHVSRDAGKWEVELKKAFKQIEIPIPGQVYKSGPRKGQQKVRKAKLSEGWALIDPTHPAYVAYAAADPLLTYRLWRFYQPVVRKQHALYQFDRRVQNAADKLQRRAMRLDVPYTERLSDAYLRKAEEFKATAASFGCDNINSGAQIAEALMHYGAVLTARTEKGQYKTDATILRDLLTKAQNEVEADANESCVYRVDLIHAILGAKQLLKRRESYTEQMLEERDSAGRVHPSINTLGARTTRMSVSNPPLQQLPTKDREGDAA